MRSIAVTRRASPIEGSFARYLQRINAFPVLKASEERRLAIKWREHGDTESAHRMVMSHLRLVVKVAYGYRGYGLALPDLVSEGNIGLMKAVRGFDPYRGFRLSTYAMWWIRASITEYVLRSWSVVKTGTVAARKKLFFGLRKIKNRLQIFEQGELSERQVNRIADALDVPAVEVVDMNRRLGGSDVSLNATVGEDEGVEFIDLLPDNGPSAEEILVAEDERRRRHEHLEEALATLAPREQEILRVRKLHDGQVTLQALAKRYGISRERVRQIEARALRKLRQTMLRPEEGCSLSMGEVGA